MLDKLKQLKEMRNISRSIQSERIEAEEGGIRVVINGAFMVEEISLNPKLDKNKQEIILKNCLNEAVKKAQATVAKRFSGLM